MTDSNDSVEIKLGRFPVKINTGDDFVYIEGKAIYRHFSVWFNRPTKPVRLKGEEHAMYVKFINFADRFAVVRQTYHEYEYEGRGDEEIELFIFDKAPTVDIVKAWFVEWINQRIEKSIETGNYE